MIQTQFKKLIQESAVQSYIFSRKESTLTVSMLKFGELSEVMPTPASQFNNSIDLKSISYCQTISLARTDESKQESVALIESTLKIY